MSTAGTIVRKPNGRWYVATHHTDGEGRRYQQSHGGFATKREAKAKLAEVLAKIHQGRHVAPNRQTLGEFLEHRWLPAIKASVHSTYDSYQRNVRLREVRPYDPPQSSHRRRALGPHPCQPCPQDPTASCQ